jgi:hypothetical protein
VSLPRHAQEIATSCSSEAAVPELSPTHVDGLNHNEMANGAESGADVPRITLNYVNYAKITALCLRFTLLSKYLRHTNSVYSASFAVSVLLHVNIINAMSIAVSVGFSVLLSAGLG